MTRRFVLWLLAAALAAAAPRFPGKTWEKARPAGWSEAKLQEARDYAGTIQTAAVMIIQGGAVVEEWGETARKFNCHSMRKSVMSALYGIHAKGGRIKLGKTLAELGIDDNEPKLTDVEKQATVLDLLKARSGIYHAALYETPGMAARRPGRGSHAPGTFWYYNNWDFNALLTIFEQETRLKFFEEVDRRLAKPLEMEDFRVEDGVYFTGEASVHPAYPIRMTARDLARFGLLYLRGGKWRDQQIVPEDWVRESTRPHSDAGSEGISKLGYGYMWWVSDNAGKTAFSARGAGGHYVWVIPERDLVIVHRVNTDDRQSVSEREMGNLLRLILAAGPQN